MEQKSQMAKKDNVYITSERKNILDDNVRLSDFLNTNERRCIRQVLIAKGFKFRVINTGRYCSAVANKAELEEALNILKARLEVSYVKYWHESPFISGTAKIEKKLQEI